MTDPPVLVRESRTLVRDSRTRTVVAVAGRPWLWPTAVGQLFRLAAPGWWHRRPFLPLPDADYLAFRLQTMYGDPAHVPEPDAVVAYLEWCRSYRRLVR